MKIYDTGGYTREMDERRLLPSIYEEKYTSENLKKQIADEGMWYLIPCVDCDMNSPKGRKRIKENDLLFSFIDEYLSDFPFAFEPNMLDGRFVCLPDNVRHQGIGLCVSKEIPGFLEICHFWYPAEFTEKKIGFGPGQVYVSMLSMKSAKDLAEIIRKLYSESKPEDERYCTFTFGNPDRIVTLRGYFLDDLEGSVKKIKNALRGTTAPEKRNAEGLIEFIQRIMTER